MIRSISVSELLNKNNIIDIRSIEKYNSSHIMNAKNIPMMLLLKDYSKYLNKNETYYIYCQKGINSVKVCETLNKKGYQVINVLGGYESWILNHELNS